MAMNMVQFQAGLPSSTLSARNCQFFARLS
jgi:hypothetical protein